MRAFLNDVGLFFLITFVFCAVITAAWGAIALTCMVAFGKAKAQPSSGWSLRWWEYIAAWVAGWIVLSLALWFVTVWDRIIGAGN